MDKLITATTTTTEVAVTTKSSLIDVDPAHPDKITHTEKIIIIVMLSLLSVVGTVGNALAIYVFANLKQKLTSTIFILTLAGTDFITCLITIPFTITMECIQFMVSVDLICKVYHFLIITTVPFSCVVIVAIAIDRYMCICHPFHHWMTIQRARIIIGALALFIFMFAGIVCLHYTIYTEVDMQLNTTASPHLTFVPFNSTADTVTATNIGACEINPNYIDPNFFSIIRYIYPGIFLVSCIIVLVLYSLIYRSVIAQRRKKLRIKSAQCCLLWNATSLDTQQEAAEMTQDIELSHVNGDERVTIRQNSTAEDPEQQNNGAVRKCSLSKARIERMRVANVKTAFTLFIVTLVFILAFLPSWLMALKIVQMHVVVFYTHYVYNVVNPLIYAFLNQNFKTELRRIFRCEKR
ncbi:unnamed protein product [Candidula unifasciata]|uniref:G-protein coupled receptors family 1 profile domain-containing protein n=1 Tax=Candidula unifasciata TaxID=100452 RepID=A0A8S3Z858_9EUPU|nr:unnamed protein product [Candidula unifasciata]